MQFDPTSLNDKYASATPSEFRRRRTPCKKTSALDWKTGDGRYRCWSSSTSKRRRRI